MLVLALPCHEDANCSRNELVNSTFHFIKTCSANYFHINICACSFLVTTRVMLNLIYAFFIYPFLSYHLMFLSCYFFFTNLFSNPNAVECKQVLIDLTQSKTLLYHLSYILDHLLCGYNLFLYFLYSFT